MGLDFSAYLQDSLIYGVFGSNFLLYLLIF